MSSLPVSPLRPIRVLVVDDSAYMRQMISQRLNALPDLEVVGAARDGRDALAQILAQNPDVVTLDLEMPNMDGLTTLREIMTQCPRPVIILSGFTLEGTHETTQALLSGAFDFVAKPDLRANITAVIGDVADKIRLAAQGSVARSEPATSSASNAAGRLRAVPRPLRSSDKVIVIGASAGGPRALSTVLAGLPPDLPAAVLLVQHIASGFTRALAERLDTRSALPVREAQPGDELLAGRCLLAPGGFHLTLDRQSKIVLTQQPPVHGVRPAIDVTMGAVAAWHDHNALAVVLTGMGSDGTFGAAMISEAGGQVLAEAESTAVVWGMPGSVVRAGLADSIVPLPEMAAAIRQAVLTGGPHGT